MVLRVDPSRLLVSHVAEGVARQYAALAKTFRGPAAFARGDQLVRASLSVVSNIAEGCGRGTVADFRRSQRPSLIVTASQIRPDLDSRLAGTACVVRLSVGLREGKRSPR
jgi:hypothetical protein